MKLFFSLALLLLPASPAVSGALDDGFAATYQLKRNSLTMGLTYRQLSPQPDNTLRFASNTVAKGLFALLFSGSVREESVIQRDGEFIRPQSYLYNQQWRHKKRRYTLIFDWANKELHSQYKNKQGRYPLPDEAQDLLSFQLAIMLGLQQGRREISFDIAGRKRPNHYLLKRAGKQTMKTALGVLEVVKLEQAPTDTAQNGVRFTFWCAEKLDFLPVRIKRIEKDGTVYLLTVKTFQRNARPARAVSLSSHSP